ncbi:LPS export ABC transporter periplasmic protein LptC [Francisella frigiditurris]|uniref:LPS export ABC transporter periplasmic protein LptC n=1 Tax=Francisella frigiditurris TaxID=1542390 RepID=A0A1J0KSR6_9GAMM|nr:LPS export ABC transporter periplasmic protein LptC [Francisella frigiditurris]APC96801.1 LPS export ABC transporter periplasmic protein LptC [Francisella frigiditurris]
MRLFFYSKYSFFVSLGFVIVVSAGVISLYLQSVKHIGVTAPNKKAITMKAYDYSFGSYNGEGKLDTYLDADYLEQYVDKSLSFKNIRAKTYGENEKKKWDVKSNFATSDDPDNKANIIRLYGNVKSIMYMEEEDTKDGAPKKIHIDTEEIFYKPQTYDFYGDDKVRIYDPNTGNNTTGVGFKGNTDTKRVKIDNDVRSYYASR